MKNRFKGFWSKFTTRFAVPLLIISQIVTLYDGWESRIEERSYQEELVRCVREHHHYTAEDMLVTMPNGDMIPASEFFDDPEMDQTGETYWEEESNCQMFDLQSPLSDYTPERTMDRWLGKIFWAYKNNKDKFVEWVNYKFMRKATEDIRG